VTFDVAGLSVWCSGPLHSDSSIATDQLELSSYRKHAGGRASVQSTHLRRCSPFGAAQVASEAVPGVCRNGLDPDSSQVRVDHVVQQQAKGKPGRTADTWATPRWKSACSQRLAHRLHRRQPQWLSDAPRVRSARLAPACTGRVEGVRLASSLQKCRFQCANSTRTTRKARLLVNPCSRTGERRDPHSRPLVSTAGIFNERRTCELRYEPTQQVLPVSVLLDRTARQPFLPLRHQCVFAGSH
jgi:hypothetical protein